MNTKVTKIIEVRTRRGTDLDKWRTTKYSKYSCTSFDLRKRKKKVSGMDMHAITCLGTSSNVYGITFSIDGKHLQQSIMASNSIENTEASETV